jgi:hypothetical protein
MIAPRIIPAADRPVRIIIIRHARRRAEPVRAILEKRLERDFRVQTEAGSRRTMVLR